MNIEPIAYYRGLLPEKFGIPRQAGLVPSLRGQIIFEPAYRSEVAVRGLEGFEYIWLIWGFSAEGQVAADKTAFQATVRPPRLGGNERIGVFASRSPFRPNGLGLSSVKLESVELEGGPVLHVSGADLMDGTPIYDIKPYVPYADSHPDAQAGFVDSRAWERLEVRFPEDLKARFSVLLSESGQNEATVRQNILALEELLAQDPRPSYQRQAGERVYGITFGGQQIRFTVTGRCLTVLNIQPA